MSREKLKEIYGERTFFTAMLERFGKRTDQHGKVNKTVLLANVKHNGKLICDHVWLNSEETLGHYAVGSKLIFTARVMKYQRGDHRKDDDIELETDYTLGHLKNVFRLE